MGNTSSFVKVAIPYAEALFESARNMQSVENIQKDLNTVLKTIKESENLENFLLNPLITTKTKKNVVNDLFLDQINCHVLNFLFILIEKRRINLFSFIVDSYISLVNELDLVSSVTLYTVVPLNEEQEEALQNKLQILTNSTTVQLMTYIKPDLIGGFVVKVGSKIIDMSIHGQLNQIASYLNGKYI